jgi:hypothetical protein
VADDPDSLDFLLGMADRFDLAALQPHFPGYPVYIGLGALLSRGLGFPAIEAATAISALASGASAIGLMVLAEAFDPRPAARFGVAALHAVAWLPWFLGSGAQSESLGAALTIWSFALLARERTSIFGGVASGVLAGLALGVRASYWPLALSALGLARRRAGLRGPLVGGLLGVAAWAVPLVGLTGPLNLIRLGRTHLAGHFVQWGGSVVTRPDPWERLSAFVRDLAFDGIAPSSAALFGAAAVACLAWLLGRRGSRSVQFDARPLLVALAPYALWVLLAQNVVEQPRHVLPLVEGALLLGGLLLAPYPRALVFVVLCVFAASAPLAIERHTAKPAAAQAADWILGRAPEGTAVFAGRSMRFFEARPERFTVSQRPRLADVIAELARVDRFPSAIWLVSELDLEPVPERWRIAPGPEFCRDARIDRAAPCLRLLQLTYDPSAGR